MSSRYTVPIHTRLSRWFLRPFFRGLFLILSRVRVTGLENVPPQGPYLVAINHISLFEPPLAVAFWPVPLEAAGAADIWGRRGQSTLVRLYGGIQVHRGEYDRDLVETMLAALRAGRPLLLAPEGGRSHSIGMRRAHPGVAYLAAKEGVPVLPVGILGTTDDFFRLAIRGKRPWLEMRIGRPLILPKISIKGPARRAALQDNADLIMAHIGALLPPEYHGFYAEQVTRLSERGLFSPS